MNIREIKEKHFSEWINVSPSNPAMDEALKDAYLQGLKDLGLPDESHTQYLESFEGKRSLKL